MHRVCGVPRICARALRGTPTDGEIRRRLPPLPGRDPQMDRPRAARGIVGAGLSRRVAFSLNVALAALGHIGVPWAASLLAMRHGWTAGRPATWNIAGLVPCAVGFTGLVWCLRMHFQRAP